MSVTSPAQSQVLTIESVPRQYSYAALAFMQIAAGGSAGNESVVCMVKLHCSVEGVLWIWIISPQFVLPLGETD